MARLNQNTLLVIGAVVIVTLILASFGLNISQPTQSGTPTTTTPSIQNNNGTCDTSLWNHVYNPQRLQVIESCKTVTGTIEKIRTEADGDFHILLRLDAGQKNLVNQGNIDQQNGDLVLEPICVNQVTQQDAIDSCSNFTSSVTIPNLGDHVRVTGSYVFDAQHGWNEIHPVTSIEILQ